MKSHIKNISEETDLYFKEPLSLKTNFNNSTYYAKKTNPQDYEWGFNLENNKIKKIVRPKENVYLDHHMYGIAYWRKDDLNLLIEEIEKGYKKEGYEYYAYDEYANLIFDDINMEVHYVNDKQIYEIDTLEDLIKVDDYYLKVKQNIPHLDDKHVLNFLNIMKLDRRDIKRIYPNPGRSANNINFVIDVENKSYLYRIPGEGSELFSDRKKEQNSYKKLDKYGITDKVLYLSPESGIKISEYYNNSRIPDSNNDIELQKSMLLLKKLHLLELDFDDEKSLMSRAIKYNQLSNEVGGQQYCLDGFDDHFVNLLEFNKYIESLNIKKVPIHGDASINNFLVLNGTNEIKMIDLEFTTTSDPFDDIATFSVDAEYRENEIIKLLELYLERKSTDLEKYRVLGLSATAALMWYSWATYKAAIEKENEMYINFRDDYQSYLDDLSKSLKKYEFVLEKDKNNSKIM